LGNDARVIADPVALKFRLAGSPGAAIAGAEKQLAAGKKYVESWEKYEKDFAEYEEKLKAEKTKKPEAKKEATKDDAKAKAEKSDADKKPVKKEEKEEKKEKPDADKDKEEKKDKEKEKEKDKDREKDKDEKKKKKPLPDPITGTWVGEIDFERIPERFRAVEFELELAEDGTVTGTMKFFSQEIEIASATYDRESRELSLTVERRGREITISGKLDADGEFEGSMPLGRDTEAPITATRTVDKSKKSEPEDEEKEDEKDKPKPDEKKDKKETKDKPAEKDKDKDKDKEKEADKDKKKEDEKKDDKKADGKKKEEPKSKLKPPKKPRKVAALEPYKALFAKEIPAFVETRDLFTIKEAAELFGAKYGVRTVIVGADALAREPDALANQNVAVIAGPKFNVAVPKQPETTNLPQLLGLTSSGAKMLSEKSRVGSIVPGNDADLVVLSGPPFEFSTKVLAVMIDGVWVYECEDQE